MLAMDLVVFRWMSTVGGLSAMYDKIDPALACDKAEEAISHLSVEREEICVVAEHVSWWRSGAVGKSQ